MASMSLVYNPRQQMPRAPDATPRVLLVTDEWDIACDLPQVFAAAGVAVDVLCPANNCAIKGGFYEGWWDAGSSLNELFERLYRLWQTKRYQKIILCDDPLMWQIAYRPIAELYPLLPMPPHAVGLLNKAGLSDFCNQHQLPTPRFFALHNKEHCAAALEQVGIPLLVKPNLSNGGHGIVICYNTQDYQSHWQNHPFDPKGYLIQQYINGTLLSVEVLFHQGHLLEYAASKMHSASLGPSSRRIYQAKIPVLTQLVQTFGQASGLDGFVNMSLIESDQTGYWLFEADPRPNRWVAFGKWFGADFSKVIQIWLFDPPTTPTFAAPEPLDHPVIENMPMYTQELINQGRLMDALIHLTNFDHTWRYFNQ